MVKGNKNYIFGYNLRIIRIKKMITVDNFNFSGKRALIRVDFNVPLDKTNMAVTDDTRIRAAIPTIKKILKDGGSVILMSHLGRPKEGPEDKYSLKHTLATLKNLVGKEVKFADDCIGASATALAAEIKSGEIGVLENLRFYKEEEKGDEAFAKKISGFRRFLCERCFWNCTSRTCEYGCDSSIFSRSKMFWICDGK